jgi:ribosomal-protein-serine acetyltransferase
MLRLELSDACHLRLLEESDAQELHATIDSNRAYLARWLPWADGHQTPAQTLEFIRSSRRQIAENDGFQTALVADGAIVGMVGFHGVDWQNHATSIGYWLTEAEQGRGTMTQAVGALVDHALSRWRLNRVEIRANVENVRSRAIPERLGFQEEGTLRQAFRVGDRYLDDVVYAMLAADWPATARADRSEGS